MLFESIIMAQLLVNNDCTARYQQQLQQDMALSYQQFDQTPDSGFRKLAADCKPEAIALLKNYIIINQAEQASLRWHIAQLLGETGEIDEAIIYAKSTLRENSDSPLKWNDYVQGYMAYWRGDSKRLAKVINVLKQAKEHPGNAMNARLLESFLNTLKSEK